jgi:hypothetical protein
MGSVAPCMLAQYLPCISVRPSSFSIILFAIDSYRKPALNNTKFYESLRRIAPKFAEYGRRAVNSFSINSLPHTTLMPRKKPSIPLRRRYTADLKQRVVYQAFTLGKKSTEIAIDLDIPVRVVQRVKHTWMQIGRVCRSQESIGRHPLLSPEQTKVFFMSFDLKFVSSFLSGFHRLCWPW